MAEAITLLAWGLPMSAADLRAECDDALRNFTPTPERGLEAFEALFLPGLEEAGDRILAAARAKHFAIYGRPGKVGTRWETTPPRVALGESDLQEAIAFNVFHNMIVPDIRVTLDEYAAAHRVQFYDLLVARDAVEALRAGAHGIAGEGLRAGPERGDAPQVDEWMRKHVEDHKRLYGVPAKRDPTLKECRVKFGCTHRAALAAWNGLSPDLKRTPRQTDRTLSGQRTLAAR